MLFRSKINGAPVGLSRSNLSTSSGDEAGAIGGIISGKTKGRAHPVMYSFDVKIEGKNVVRNADPFTGNDRNTPPGPIIQSQPAPGGRLAEKEEKATCAYCDKDEHKFTHRTGQNVGMSGTLSRNIFDGQDKEAHPGYSGLSSLAAHHIICSESMDEKPWATRCREFGYNINHKNNGMMLPMKIDLACQVHAPLHLGGHAKGWADDLHLPYPDAVKEKIKEVADGIEAGDYCDDPKGVIDELDDISREILANIDNFTWTITADGKDYQTGGCGCADVNSISDKKEKTCTKKRSHAIKQYKTKKVIGAKDPALKIGE